MKFRVIGYNKDVNYPIINDTKTLEELQTLFAEIKASRYDNVKNMVVIVTVIGE